MPNIRKYPLPQPGDVFGLWLVIGPTRMEHKLSKSGKRAGKANIYYVTPCRCTKTSIEKDVSMHHLVRGASTGSISAALILRDLRGYAEIIPDKHLRDSWVDKYCAMISRCYTTTSQVYPRYGGRGIRVSDEFKDSCATFLSFIITIPGWDDPAKELDRRDNNGDYTRENIRLVPRKINANNRRNTLFVAYNGEMIPAGIFHEKFAPLYPRSSHVSTRVLQGRTAQEIIDGQERYRT